MRQALVIAQRELAEKRFVAFAALAFAALPFLMCAVPVIRGNYKAGDVIAVSAGLLAIGFTGGLALILGASMIGRDLSEGRLSFYFSRPVSAASIWFGKFGAAAALIAGAFLIIAVPARLAAGAAWTTLWGTSPWLSGGVLAGAIALFLAVHAVSTCVRSRSPFIALDFAALCVAAGIGYALLRAITGATRATLALALLFAAGGTIALAGAGAWQLARGRTDRRRNHLGLSQFLWVVVAITLAAGGAFVAWLASATPADLKSISVRSHGPWAVLIGQARHRFDYNAAFIYNTETGWWRRMRGRMTDRVSFTRDGRSVLLGRYDHDYKRLEIFRCALAGGTEEATGLTLSIGATYVANDDGSRIATADNGLLAVYDVPSKRSMGSARLPQNELVSGMFFASPGVLRLYAPQPEGALNIYEFDFGRRALVRTGRIDCWYPYVSVSAEGSRALVLRNGVTIIDARTAEVLIGISAHDFNNLLPLQDGGFAVSYSEPGHTTIDVYDARTVVKRLDVPAKISSLRELRDGRLITLAQVQPRRDDWHTLLIDPRTGAMQTIPARPANWRSEAPGDPRVFPLDLPTLFLDGRLVRWNYAANRAEVVLRKD